MPSAALAALREEERELGRTKRHLIAQARYGGCSWEEVGVALGVSKQAAWDLYSAEITAMLDATADHMQLTEEEAMALALEEIAADRQERRSRQRA